MIRKIHHINFLVHDLAAGIAAYQSLLGVPPMYRDELPARGVRTARFLVGATWLVLVQPTRPDTAPARHLAVHGEGFFLMSLEVDSLDAAMASVGEEMVAGPERRGLDDWRVVDLRREATCGVQLQLVEDPASG